MKKKIHEAVTALQDEIVNWRRDFHRYPEAGWTEFRTAAKIAEKLTALGYEVKLGEEVIDKAAMMGVPSRAELAENMARAARQGGNGELIEAMRGGLTGVVGILRGKRPGPVLALRFDIDANEVPEAATATHRPWQEGFASQNKGVMHACGHDGHAAIGLGVASVLATLTEELSGSVKLIFQPAEEGVRGAKAMVEAGVVDDVDYLLGMHLGFLADRSGLLVCGTDGFLATTKLDVAFKGVPAHAGAAPQEGRNALLAAANAALNLHAISRHSGGISRINVGVLEAGSGRNVIADRALLKLETRGETTQINQYMKEEALRVIAGAAAMYGVTAESVETGSASGGSSDAALALRLGKVAERQGAFEKLQESGSLGASEDFTCFLERVQQRGGQGSYAMLGINRTAGHHDGAFDFDEAVLAQAVELIVLTACDIVA